jgi:hypothetical protein
VLACHADRVSNVDLRVEAFVPLRVGQVLLLERVEREFLVVDGDKRVLVLLLCQNSLFDQSIQSQGIRRCAHSIPIGNSASFYLRAIVYTVLGSVRMPDLFALLSTLAANSPCAISFCRIASFMGASKSIPAFTAVYRIACWALRACCKFV